MQIPIFWINLERTHLRRKRMEWALKKGNWISERFDAIDAANAKEIFLPIPNLLKISNKLPGIRRSDEVEPWRKTNRQELACLASWKRLLMRAKEYSSTWNLIMEDDLGASLAIPKAWPITLQEIIKKASTNTLVIQLAPISSKARLDLFQYWENSQQKKWLIPKRNIKSHGNGAVLINKHAMPYLINYFERLISKSLPRFHPLFYPIGTRAVADKWLYASLPENSCEVLTYPIFCLDAKDSSLHSEHVVNYHIPSKEVTLKIWEKDERMQLIEAQRNWDNLNK